MSRETVAFNLAIETISQAPSPLVRLATEAEVQSRSCLVCGDPKCNHRCNPTAAAAWDAIDAVLSRLEAKAQTTNETASTAIETASDQPLGKDCTYVSTLAQSGEKAQRREYTKKSA